jgi:hypothetical protein
MSGGTFVLLLALGGGAIAVWIHVRFPNVGPRELRRVLIHVVVSFAAIQLAVPVIKVAADASDLATLAGVFGVAFPALVYTFLVSIWVIRTVQGALHHH